MRKHVVIRGKKREGYMFLLTVLFVGTVAFSIMAAYIVLAISSAQNSTTVYYGEQALANAFACADTAIFNLQDDITYTGNEVINLEDGICSIYTTAGTGVSDRILCVEGAKESTKRRFEIFVDNIVPNVAISQWREVDDISSCCQGICYITSGLVGWWKMDNTDTGETEVTDDSGNDYHGTRITGTAGVGLPEISTTDVAPIPGNVASLRFTDKVDDFNQGNHVDVPSDVIVEGNADRTACAWGKITNYTTTTGMGFFHFGGNGSAWNRDFALKPDWPTDWWLIQHGGSSYDEDVKIDDTVGNWKHYCLARDGSENETLLYVDGFLHTTHIPPTGNPFNTCKTNCDGSLPGDSFIGKWADNQYLTGYMDDVRMYDRLLDPSEILSIANGQG